MPKLSEVATFNRNSLLREYSEQFYEPDFQAASIMEYPGEDYVKAASLTWSAMRAMATRARDNRMDGNNGKPGYILHNVTMTDVIDLLWPTLAKAYRSRVTQGIRKVLREGNNADAIGMSSMRGGRRGLAYDWW